MANTPSLLTLFLSLLLSLRSLPAPQSAYPHTLSLLSNISSSFRLGVGVKLKEMVLRSSVGHGSVKFPFQSRSVSARFIFEVCGVVPVCQHGF